MSKLYEPAFAEPKGALIRPYPSTGILMAQGAGVPTASASGYSKGCIYLDLTNGNLYINTGTLTSATWSAVLNSAVATLGTAGLTPGQTSSTVFYSGGMVPAAVATGTDKTAVNTETYIVELFVPHNCTLTGIQWLGLATSTGNVQFSLADATGAPIAAAQTASTATAGTANFQTAAFATPYAAKGPGKYFVLMQNSGSNHFRAHAMGVFGASKKTGETYGTFTSVTPPTTFTADLGPILATY